MLLTRPFFYQKALIRSNISQRIKKHAQSYLIKCLNLLQEILDSFQNTEFWYVDEGKQSSIACTPRSFRQVIHRNDEKWWLPIPCVPDSGLPEGSQKELLQKRECANQIHKAAKAINSAILAEMEVPESYLAALPKV